MFLKYDVLLLKSLPILEHVSVSHSLIHFFYRLDVTIHKDNVLQVNSRSIEIVMKLQIPATTGQLLEIA